MKRARTVRIAPALGRESGVFGSGVKNLEGRKVGVITDVAVDCTYTKIAYVLIEIDLEFAGMAATGLLVTWNSLRLNLDTGDEATPYLLKITPAQVRRACPLDPLTFIDLLASAASHVSCRTGSANSAPLWCVTNGDSRHEEYAV